nr:reverse transcriptase domain-containing protein [Tanacetum cinerariifolium]
MADQRTIVELLRAPTEGYKDLLRACLHHGFTELHQLDTFYNALNPADQDSLNAAAGGTMLERCTQDVLTIIENKSKVHNSRNKLVVSQIKSCNANSNSSSEIAKLTHAVNPQTSVVTTTMTAILKQFQATPPQASVKAVEEIFVTCGGAHPNYQRLVAGGNTFPKLRDNIQTRPSGSRSLPSNTISNSKSELKAITTRSGIVLYGPFVPIPSSFINQEEDERVEETLTDQDLAKYTIKKMLKALLFNKEKLQEPANTPLNENCLAVILKKLPEKLGDPRKFLILYGFNELKCKALADLGASINLMPLSVWKKLGLPKLISTRMTLELANQTICTPAGIARDVFIPVGKFTFPTGFVIVDYDSDHKVPLILGRPFLRTARALIDVHGEEMILRDDLDSTIDLHPPLYVNPLSGSTTYSSPTYLLEEFDDELAFITFPLEHDDDLQFDIKSDLKEIEYLLHHDPIKDIDSSLKDSMDQSNLADLNDKFVNSMPEMFTDEHALDYSSPPLYDEYDDELFKVESDTENVYDDPFDFKGKKIKESKLLIDKLDLPYGFLPSSEYDSLLFEDFSKVDALPSTNNEDKVFNPCILIQENLFEVITHVAPEKKDKKLAISNASLVIEDVDPPLYELPFFKEVSRSKMLLLFSSKNEEKVFKPGIHTFRKVYSSLIT